MKNIPIGQYMVNEGIITEEQLQNVLDKKKEENTPGKYFGDYVIELGYVTDIQFGQVLARKLNVPFIDLNDPETSVNTEAVKKIPEALAKKHTIIAVKITGKRLTVATHDPVNFYIFEDIKVTTGMDVVPVLTTPPRIPPRCWRALKTSSATTTLSVSTRSRLSVSTARLSLSWRLPSLRILSVRTQRISISNHLRPLQEYVSV